MNDTAIATLLARSPAIDPHSATLDLGATLKPALLRSAVTAHLSRDMAAADTLARDTRRHGNRESDEDAPQQPSGYDILGELGRGGMGIVYRARQRTLRREVAVKRLQADDAFLREAFLTESMVTGELEHPNIVPVYALCEEEQGGLWLVMKRIGGRTLAELIAEAPSPRDPRTLDRFLDVILGIADALRFAHSRGILHRDIKPANVMVGSFGEVMLLDWGIAAYFADEASAPHNIPHVRHLDVIAGTPLYMPPEMAEGRGEDCGPWSDVYLLGATLYEVITGAPPRRGQTLMDALTGAGGGVSLSFAESIPTELQQICRRALANAPAARYSDIDAFQLALRDYLENRESRALVARAEEGLARWRTDIATGLDTVSRPRIYRQISEVISSYQHACLLSPENTAAREGELVARRAWAKAAIDGGDLGVATTAIEGLTDSKTEVLRRRLETVSEARQRTLRFARWLGAGLIAGQLLLITGLGVFGWIEMRRFTHAEILEELQRIAPAAATALTTVDQVNRESLDEIADSLGRRSELHLLLVDIGGEVLADSDSEPGDPQPAVHTWPELAAVLGGAAESWAEHPGGNREDVLSLARPWQHADGTRSVMVLSLPRNTLDGSLHSILVGGLVALLLSFLIWSAVVMRISRRLAVALSRVL